MLEIEATSTVWSLTETCINLVQYNNGTDDVDLSLPNVVDFEDINELEESISVLTYVNSREEIPISLEQDFEQQVISRYSTGNLHNSLNILDSSGRSRLLDSTPENETITLQTRTIE